MTPRLAAAVLLLLQAGGLPPEASVVPSQVASLSGYSEGIVFDSAGNAYVSLLHRNQIVRIRPGGKPEVWATLEEPNGHKILPDGTHLVAARYGVIHLGTEGTILDTTAARFENAPLRGPNDIALDGNGGFYFTDPASTPADQAARRGRVFYVDAQRRLYLTASDFCYANGILVRADGRVLYVDDSCTSHVYAFDISGPGRIANRRVFALLPDSGRAGPDGMTADTNGNLFVAHYGTGRVEVLDSNGTLVRRFPAGSPLASNVAFGGPRLDELYVTGAPGDESGPGVLMRLSIPGVRGRSSRAIPAAVGARTTRPRPAASRPIVFASKGGAASDPLRLFTIAEDGSGRRRLAHQSGFNYNMPAWAPDGRRIAAIRTRFPRADGTDVVVMDSAGGEEQVVAHFRDAAYFPDWSPDGRRLVVVAGPGLTWDVLVITLDDRRVETILPADTAIFYLGPAWLRDGAGLLISENTKGHTRILQLDLARHKQRVLLSTDAMWLAGPAPSPDGREILLTGSTQSPFTPVQANLPHLDQDVYVMNADGTGLRRLTDDSRLSNTGQWSPDGRQIVFASDRHATGNNARTYLDSLELYVMRRDGSGIRRLTTNAVPDLHPRWQH